MPEERRRETEKRVCFEGVNVNKNFIKKSIADRESSRNGKLIFVTDLLNSNPDFFKQAEFIAKKIEDAKVSYIDRGNLEELKKQQVPNLFVERIDVENDLIRIFPQLSYYVHVNEEGESTCSAIVNTERRETKTLDKEEVERIKEHQIRYCRAMTHVCLKNDGECNHRFCIAQGGVCPNLAVSFFPGEKKKDEPIRKDDFKGYV